MAEVPETSGKHCEKRRNCSLRAISPFPTVYSKDLSCRHVKTRPCMQKAYDVTGYEKLGSIKLDIKSVYLIDIDHTV